MHCRCRDCVRKRDVLRLLAMLLLGLTGVVIGEYFQATYRIEPPFFYFWVGVAISFMGKALIALGACYCLYRAFCVAWIEMAHRLRLAT